MAYITMETTCDEGIDPKDIDVNYLIMDALSPYNIILGWPTLNCPKVVISTLYLNL